MMIELCRRGESRGRSAASSRSSTPNPAWMRDDELMDADNFSFSGDAYAERGPYDIDYTSLPGPSSSSSSHPAAIPYDDPYADDVGVLNVAERQVGLEVRAVRGRERAHHAHGRGRGRGGHRDRGHARGGGGRGRERDREGRRQGGHQQIIQPPSTTPVGIAQRNNQATGYFGLQQQQSEYSPFYPEQHPLPLPFPPYATYPMMQMQPASPMTPFNVQPHINPRFASAFGLASPAPPPPPASSSSSLAQQEYLGGTRTMYSNGASSHAASSDWAGEWSVPMQESGSRE